MASKWMTKLAKLDGAVLERCNPFHDVVRTPSPSVNFIFGGGWGLPRSYSMVLYGPPKAGKTILVNSMIGQLHHDDPEAIAVKYDTEMREQGQNTDAQMKLWGIDPDRYMAYMVNEPGSIFDKIEHDLAGMIDEGAPIKLVIIDSITGIQGRRAGNADSVNQMQIGDHALTIQDGLKRIIPTLRRKKIALVMTVHIRAEMDMAEQMRGKKFKMAGSYALKHTAEYFVLVEPNQSKAGKTSLEGKEFVDDNVRDLMDHADKTGHKIRVKMEDSSVGPKGRVGEFTLDYNKGIVNVHEEVFLLGVNRGVIETPSNVSYVFNGEKYHGKQAMLAAIRDNKELSDSILKELRRRDLEGSYSPAESSPEESSE